MRNILRVVCFLGGGAAAACGLTSGDTSRGELGVFTVEQAGMPAAHAADGGGPLLVGRVADTTEDHGLRARITTPGGLTLTVLTVTCAGECADVVAEAHGGHPPYHVRWEDGSTSVTRHVCPRADGQLKLEVTDTAIDDLEFPYAAQTAVATVTSQVLECPEQTAPVADAGASAPDAAPPPRTCVSQAISMDAAAGCTPLTTRQTCEADSPGSIYTLPFPLASGHRSCMVAFGVVPFSREPALWIWAGEYSTCLTPPQEEELVLDSGQLPKSTDPDSEGRVLCLTDPPAGASTLLVSPGGTYEGAHSFQSPQADLDALDLRICDVCPL